MANYTVVAGDTLWGIASRHGTTVADLQATNNLIDANMLSIGQVLAVPDPPGTAPAGPAPVPQAPVSADYVVVSGDTLFGIARRFGTTAAELVALNALSDPNLLSIGQVLRVGVSPTGSPAASPTVPASLFGARASDPALVALVAPFEGWADAFGISRTLVKALGFVESGWRVDAVSSSGAVGVCQVLPSTAAWINTALFGGAHLDPMIGDQNIHLACGYLRFLHDLIGDEGRAVAAYFQGPGSVQRDGLKPDSIAYVARVADARTHFS